MKPAYIHHLLVEASTADWRRANAIQCELGAATAAMRDDGTYEIDTPAAGIHALLDALFVKLYQETPQLLPAMLPVFAMICGDEKGTILTTR